MDRTTALVVGLVALVLVGGFVALAASGRDTSQYAIFVGGPAVSALVGALLVKRTAALSSDLDVVKHQTNSLLQNRLTGISDKLDVASDERAAESLILRPATPIHPVEPPPPAVA